MHRADVMRGRNLGGFLVHRKTQLDFHSVQSLKKPANLHGLRLRGIQNLDRSHTRPQITESLFWTQNISDARYFHFSQVGSAGSGVAIGAGSLGRTYPGTDKAQAAI